MSSIYHIIKNGPALHQEDMPLELEELAVKLVKSGLLRIDAYSKINFARFYLPQIKFSCMFSKRELEDPLLLPRTKKIIEKQLQRYYKKIQISNDVEEAIVKLKNEIKRYVPVEENLELQIARLIAQIIHPVVIELAIIEKVQVFVSYSYNIGDVLDIVSWQHNGMNSGMQSAMGNDVAIYISCGGDPFDHSQTEEKIDNKSAPRDEITYGPGKPALARMMIIGAQEFGHYSDLIRNQHGQYIARHAADLYCHMPNPRVQKLRLADIDHIHKIKGRVAKYNFARILKLEHDIKFYDKYRVKTIRVFVIKLYVKFIKNRFFKHVTTDFPQFGHMKNFAYPVITLSKLFEDMLFNLAPKADVYSNPDKNIEDAIACVEALARVPQQCNKWGDEIVKLLYPNLYDVYYHEVIPFCIKDFESYTKRKFVINLKSYTYHKWYKIKFVKLLKYLHKKTKLNFFDLLYKKILL